MNERLDPKLTDDERADIDDEIDFIFHRAGLLRRGEFCVVLSAVVSGLLVALCVLEEATGFSADILNSALLLASVALIVLSTVFLSLEIRLSLRAIKLVVSKLPPVADAFDDAVAARAAQAVEARHQSFAVHLGCKSGLDMRTDDRKCRCIRTRRSSASACRLFRGKVSVLRPSIGR